MRYDTKHTSYTHRILWNASQHLYEQAREDSANSFYMRISCLVMLYSALESYTNYLGEILKPDVWRDERTFFNSEPYKGTGTLGKVQFLMKECRSPELDKSRRPYQTLRNLQKARNFLVHGRTEEVQQEMERDPQEMPKAAVMFLDKHATKAQLKQALEDVEQVIRTLHQAAQSAFQNDRNIKLDLDPLIGTERLEIGSSKL